MAHSIKTILGRKVNLFNTYSDPIFGIFRNFLITEKTEKFFRIFFLEILKLDFRIPGKFLNGILVQHCLFEGFSDRHDPTSGSF